MTLLRIVARIALPVLVIGLMFGLVSTYQEPSPAATVASRVAPTTTGCPAPRAGVQKGVAVLWRQLTATPANQQRAGQIVQYARSVHANSLSVGFLINTSGLHGNRVYAGPQTPSVSSLRQILVAAKAAGLRVTLRPLIDESNIPRPRWRGTIQPSSPAAWFQSYGTLMVGYARLARSTCADELTVGVELGSMQRYTSAWAAVASRVRGVGYRGDLSYAANWNTPIAYGFARHPGVDFYPRLTLPLSATGGQVTTAMTQAFSRMPVGVRRSLVVQETGFPATGGSYANPSGWNSSKAVTSRQQATWFASACRSAIRIHATGIYFWVVDSWANPFNPDPKYIGSFAFERRPAESAVRSCFAQRW